MNEIKFELRVGGNKLGKEIEDEFKAAVNSVEGVEIKNSKATRAFGMTGAEIVISFVVSAAASVLVHVLRHKIDEAVQDLADKLEVKISVKHEDDKEK